MTGYAQARVEAEAEAEAVTVTLKAVNHRFFDARWQVPGELEGAQAELEKRLRAEVRRGHVEVRIGWERVGARAAAGLDGELVEAYLRAHAELSQRLDLREPPSVGELLRFPGVLAGRSAEAAPAAATAALASAFGQALAQLQAMRRHEGAALAEDLQRRLERIATAGRHLAAHRQELEAALLERLRRRLAELLPTTAPSPERLLQEAALLAERGDVSEELTRLEAHVAQFRTLLAQGGEVGKRLDFLTQELHREVNTLLSKTSSAAPAGLRIAELGLELKAEIEKIREQVQNLE
ncbi:MAG TPA: YicC/YloC family endoribonuclease [Terriglobales bacterium]|nr:YicC/YloC family endoribonuclease [Terriglobales bacterium]